MKKQVWVIEDDPDIGEIVTFLLDSDGHEVRLFENATSFENSLRQGEKPDLFVMDVMLPDGDGVTLCELVKSNYELSSIPVMMMSAHASLDKVRLSCRAEEFMPKPFDIDELSAKVQQLLS